jgi:predicted AlkP superfamily pyrophosphatase or phosphodiesterase
MKLSAGYTIRFKMIFSLISMFMFLINANAQKAKHVVLITIDGFRADFYRDKSWGTVNLHEMAEMGISANGVNSVFPTLTFPNHTSIITGVRPAKHGIIYNVDPLEPERELYWYSKFIKAPTLWDISKKAGLKTASVNWPVSAGNVIDYNIPIIKTKGKTQLQATADNSFPAGLMDEVQTYATGKLDNNTFNTNKDYLVIDENVARIAGYLIKKYKPSLTTIRLSATDHFEHEEGRDGPMVRKAIAGADRAVRSIIESVEQAGLSASTVIIVTGDHGFVDSHTALAPNVWLSEAGIVSDVSKPDWKAMFVSAGGSAFLRLKDKSDKKTFTQVQSILSARSSAEKKLFRVIQKSMLDSLQVDPDAMLALAAIQGITFSSANSGPSIRSVKMGTHGYFPDFKEIQTGFVAYGPGLKKGIVIPVMETIDIAPLVAELLGLQMENIDGILYKGLIDKNSPED